MTFSVVGWCERTAMLGVATASASLGCGAWAQSAKTATGAIASQAFANPFFGSDGLRLLGRGLSAAEVVSELVQGDPGREFRQLLVADGHGATAAFTGAKCLPWAGHRTGTGLVAGGNTLAGEYVLTAIYDAFANSSDRELPERLVRALEAGDRAGGDVRGRHSAALSVCHDQDYRYYDIRVDDHVDPVAELRRLFDLRRRGWERLGTWRPTRDAPLDPEFLERYKREAAEATA